jgi:hypothetical protein
MTFRKLSARTSICLAFVVALALPGQLHSEEVLSRLITQPDPGSPGFEGADLMVTDTATGSSRFVATVIQPNEGPAGTGGAVGQINYDPVSRTVAVQYQLRSNGANPNVFGINNVDTGGLISNVVSSPEGFGFGATDAYYALPPDNSAQVQQNTAQIAATPPKSRRLRGRCSDWARKSRKTPPRLNGIQRPLRDKKNESTKIRRELLWPWPWRAALVFLTEKH